MSERVLQGPFLTRAQAARLAGVPARLLVHRPDLLALRSRWLPEAYFALQFDDSGVRHDVGRVVQHLKGRVSDIDIADWLVRPNRSLRDSTPLEYLDAHGRVGVERVLAAADSSGPVAEDAGFRPRRTRHHARKTVDPALSGHSPPGSPTGSTAAPRSRDRSRRTVSPGSKPAPAAR